MHDLLAAQALENTAQAPENIEKTPRAAAQASTSAREASNVAAQALVDRGSAFPAGSLSSDALKRLLEVERMRSQHLVKVVGELRAEMCHMERRHRVTKKTTKRNSDMLVRRIAEGMHAVGLLNMTLSNISQRLEKMEEDISDLNRVANYLVKQPPHEGVYYDEADALPHKWEKML
ncbi:hypothetical protein B0T16DRAFT_461741 [Cercophora newfieldiana]|uniref:Uncharacterized protein n=1 Tax=Cercophora newfieldiana TaxID=92897 RepID=A0AA40CLT6_9PEZI|nr:hypothetical protein B0T16DRAFT_461741 [Cercophora newfieldiana]